MNFAKQYKIKNEGSLKLNHEERETIRLNKYISDAGVASRREADKMIEVKRVKVNGKIAEVGTRIYPDDIVMVDNKVISPKQDKVYIALHKPIGIISTTDTAIKGNMITFMNYKEKIFPVGRLDKDSSGLILLSNDGDIVNKILRVENGHDKEYFVKVDKKITKDFVTQMESGVIIYNPVQHKNQRTLPCEIIQVDEYSFRITLKQGLNRQIRRMCEALGYHVEVLRRDRIMTIHLNDLPEGYWRYLTEKELNELNEFINKK
ncbi:pseudouridine synthase [Acholeplasma hippikon]|uniref:Pseudouridine synthase n=1 Tax=Acholeplasma hippikon TaxID=264636 RepID=A0A449BIS6_9MOLU|nr:pseudouridine synthase [Acholeplasma hippikon]VEU82338.1 ribosomal large subunit pseudouridine synthase B [Acholeplasma hippikon]